MRVSSVIAAVAGSCGTLKSTRMSTRLPRMGRSLTVCFIAPCYTAMVARADEVPAALHPRFATYSMRSITRFE